jgi:hypothetical protein
MTVRTSVETEFRVHEPSCLPVRESTKTASSGVWPSMIDEKSNAAGVEADIERIEGSTPRI